ncbi:MAG: carbohydrate kinase [Clostridiales Family XIII bacterium]|jgi:fructokinase|nr:carbohydrate kinase [Clostridiales Family XIII bacterium]
MSKAYDIIGFGECLIDLVAIRSSDGNKVNMEGTAGGATLNVCAAAAKLGRKTAYITKIGPDLCGRFIRDQIEQNNVEYRGYTAKTELTTLAVVTLDETGDREFAFYQNGTASATLSVDDIDFDFLREGRIFNFGTVNMTNEITFEANVKAAKRAKADGVIVAFDPNYRTHLWPSEREAVRAMRAGFEIADYIKASEEEAEIFTGSADPSEAAKLIMEQFRPKFLAVTLGSLGAIALSPFGQAQVPAYRVSTVDTTAAGDAFWGAALHKLLEYEDGGRVLDSLALEELLAYANAAGSHATTIMGAMPSLADEADILKLCNERHCERREAI